MQRPTVLTSRRSNSPPRGEAGIVVYTAAFLASIRASATDEIWNLYGLIINDTHPRIVTVLWIDGRVSCVLRSNLAPVYSLRAHDLPVWYKARFGR